jgi:hypothetical protein
MRRDEKKNRGRKKVGKWKGDGKREREKKRWKKKDGSTSWRAR